MNIFHGFSDDDAMFMVITSLELEKVFFEIQTANNYKNRNKL